MNRSLLALPLISALAGLWATNAIGQVRYDLLPLSFSVSDAQIAAFNGDYTITGYIETNGKVGPVYDFDGSLLDVRLDISGPLSGYARLDGYSEWNGLYGTAIATPEALYLEEGDGFFASPFSLVSSACPACDAVYLDIAAAAVNGVEGFRVSFNAIDFEGNGFAVAQTPYNPPLGTSGSFTPSSNGVFAVNNGALPGSSPVLPIMPTRRTDTQANGVCCGLVFENVPSGAWYDPPATEGYDYAMLPGKGALFTSILDFPAGFDMPFEVSVEGVTLGVFGPGEPVDFVSLLGHGVETFRVSGIVPGVDPENPQAFPIKLAFDQPLASFEMTPIAAVPEPSAMLLAMAACLSMKRRLTAA